MPKIIKIFILASLLLSFSNAHAVGMNAAQKAMNAAERITNGKALGARFVDRDGRKGYRVRIIKGGKISHIFIPLRKQDKA